MIMTTTKDRQQGAVLITVLIYLLVLSMMGVSSMHGTAMEERMASNSWEQARAFNAAESALLDAGQWFLLQPDLTEASSDGSTGVWQAGSVADAIVQSTFDWQAHGITYGSNSGESSSLFSDLFMLPQYVIEESGFEPSDSDPDTLAKKTGVFYYSFSAVGYGRSEGSRAILQTTLQKHNN
jgi:type IV pilus assembly protein PilX